MLALRKAVDEIKFHIPREILEEAFIPKIFSMRNLPPELDDQLLSMVIRPRVLVDMDLAGGTEAFVSLEGIPAQRLDAYLTVYNIPKDRTQGRSIVAVKSVSFLSASLISAVPGFQLFNPCTVTAAGQAGQAVFDAMNSVPVTSTAKVRLVGENSILIQDSMPPAGHGFLRCTIANEEDLGNIQFRYIPVFTKLAVLATKAYIYTNLIIKIDQAFLSGGKELGAFADIVREYADANEMYEEHLRTKWKKSAFMNDREKMNRFIRLQVGPR